ncbi:class I SAM-dependent methyltransferase [Hydrogenophaga pseudoflava]|uniref:class I SAM-dependent methyltransferase n=1 Tax=Hydrogenophaga pseudoflava TaxID=47421 RepID=UPI0027E5BCEB|nr:class I SAM-dependent methyltransferase [Hydrogenophaga pseudoflava]MDQ7747107.1 glycosyltransferase [Hydrogenophaga pseudoflava]
MHDSDGSLLEPLLSPALDSLFRTPQRLGKPSGWWGHVPFAFWLVQATEPRLLVELGTHHGVSYAAFCDAVQQLRLPTRCFAVDNWQGDAHAGFFDEAVYRDVHAFNEAHYGGFSELIRADFGTAVGHFADGSIDLLHIDGFHTYEAVRHDYETWRPKLSEQAVVLFHDTNVRRDDFGVHRFFAELAGRHPHFEFLHGNGLGVIAHGHAVPPAVEQLCNAASTAQGGAIRERFAAAGARWIGHANEREMERSFALQVEALVAARAQVGSERDQAQAAVARLNAELALERDAALRKLARLDAEMRAARQERALAEHGLTEASQTIATLAQAQQTLTHTLQTTEPALRQLLSTLLAPREQSPVADRPGVLQRLQWRLGRRGAPDPRQPVIDAVRRSVFFDAAWYLAAHADVAQAGVDPAVHYALFGGVSEGRDPGPWFSTLAYLEAHPDVAQDGLNALYHFEFHGRHEGRGFPLRPLGLPLPATPSPVPVIEPSASAQDAKLAFRQRSQEELARFLKDGHELRLPTAEAPRVSIVIVLHNQAELTFKCLASLVEAIDAPCEVLLIDNASTDATAALLARVRGARVLPQSENLHFLRAANLGATHARGEHLLFLNNDAQLKPGSILAALALLDGREHVGAVGGKVVLMNGRLQEAGSIVWADGSCSGYGRGEDPDDAVFQFRREVDYCSGAFLMVRRALFEGLGGFDPAYAPAYYEETDFCMRLHQAGYSVVYEPQVEILHYEFGSSESEQTAVGLMQAHREVFVARHAQVLAREHRPHGTRAIEVRQRPATQPRVLLIDDRIPVPSLGSGFPRARQLVHSLHAAGAFVSHYPLTCPQVDLAEAYGVLPREVEIVAGRGITGLADFLRERCGYYDAVIVSRPHNMDRFLHACREVPAFLPGTALIYDAEAIFATRETLRAQVLGEPSPEEEGATALTRELQLAEAAHHVFAVSNAEADRFRQAGCQDVRVLGNGIAAQPTPQGHSERRHLLFVGRLAEEGSPNADSVCWFVREVMPRLDQLIGEGYVLHLVGSPCESLQQALDGPRVVFHGRVEDIRHFYEQARVFIAPTRFAAGIPLKVQEAAAHGVPVVASALVAAQLGWAGQGGLLSADSAEDFAQACARLYFDAALWQKTRQAALAAVERDCAPQAFEATVRAVLREACEQSGRQVDPAPGSDRARVSEAWSVSPSQRQEIQGMNWMAHPRVMARLHQKATGKEGMDVYIHLKDTLTRLGWQLPVPRMVSLGCGFGALERGFAQIGLASRIDGYDIAEGAIAGARTCAAEMGLDQLHYHVADLERLELPEASCDLVVGFQSIHHVNDLDRLFGMVRRALRPGGIFHLHEYVGPDRFQWTDAQLTHMNAFLQTLPERYHRLPNGVLRGPRERPRAADVIACDPSEAIRSSQIIPTLQRHFRVLDRRDLGGALLHIGLSDIAQNFSESSAEDVAHLDRFFALEDRLMAEGQIGSDFAVLTAVRPHDE